MDYSELVQSIATEVLEELGVTEAVIKVGRDKYNLDSVSDKEKEEFTKRLDVQNKKIDNETAEEKANRVAQFKKAHLAA